MRVLSAKQNKEDHTWAIMKHVYRNNQSNSAWLHQGTEELRLRVQSQIEFVCGSVNFRITSELYSANILCSKCSAGMSKSALQHPPRSTFRTTVAVWAFRNYVDICTRAKSRLGLTLSSQRHLTTVVQGWAKNSRWAHEACVIARGLRLSRCTITAIW